MATTPATFALSTAEALDFAITAIRHLSRDEAIAIVAAIRDHLDGANCGETSCLACRPTCSGCASRGAIVAHYDSCPDRKAGRG